jgi:hypothetical protein
MAATRRPSSSEESTGRFIVGKIFELLLTALESKNVVAALVAFTVMFLGWVWLLPPDQRIKANPGEIAHALAELLGHGLLIFGGWGLSVLLIAIGSPIFYLQHRRIRKQGADNVRLRAMIIKLQQSQGSDRLSAGDVNALRNYPQDSAKRFDLTEEKSETTNERKP